MNQNPKKTKRNELLTSSDTMYVDEERSMILYEAIKLIGNPEAIGNHYSFSWDDIIAAGFRNASDFLEKGISSLEELETFITIQKSKK